MPDNSTTQLTVYRILYTQYDLELFQNTLQIHVMKLLTADDIMVECKADKQRTTNAKETNNEK